MLLQEQKLNKIQNPKKNLAAAGFFCFFYFCLDKENKIKDNKEVEIKVTEKVEEHTL